MKHRYTIKFAVNLLILVGLTIPQLSQAQVRAGAAYLKIVPGTRQQGVSGSMTAGLDESFSIYSNPGATGLLREWQFAMSYTKWIADINNASIFAGKQFDFSTPFSRNIYAGLGLNSQGVDVQSTNGLQPAASARDVLITGSIGVPLNKILENLSIGANIKYLNSDLDVTSINSLLFDVGLIYRTQRFKIPVLPFDGIFSIGGSINHLGQSLEYGNLQTPLPKVRRLGAAFNIGTHDGLQLQFVGDLRQIRDEEDQYGLGVEVMNFLSAVPGFDVLGLDNRFGRLLTFRMGWLKNDQQDNNILSDLSFGFSFNFDDFMNYRAKTGNGGFATRNSAWRLDMANQSNNSIAGDVSHFGGTYIPNGPEAFAFDLPPGFMTTDTVQVDFSYQLGDEIELIWQASHDPDLYDNTNYIVLVTKNKPVLERILQTSIFENRMNEPFATDPDSLIEAVRYHPAKKVERKPAQLVDDFYIQKNENHLSYETARAIDSSKVEFFYFFPHLHKADNLVDFSNFAGSTPSLAPDSTFTFNQKENKFQYKYRPRFDDCDYSNDYYWTVIAYDKNFHQEIVTGETGSIAHFKVVGRPDLTININRVDSVTVSTPETFLMEDVNFNFGESDISELYEASKDTLDKWVERLKNAAYDSILVYGFTDATGSVEFNQNLSRKRAESIAKYLSQNGVRSVFYQPLGLGESVLLPRLEGESVLEWNRRNRRVRLRVVKEPPPKHYFARIDVTNVGDIESPSGFEISVFDQTDNFVEKAAQAALGAPAILAAPFEVDISVGSNETIASKVPGFIDPYMAIYPDTTNFRFDTLDVAKEGDVTPDTTFEFPGISCGETVSFVTTWNEHNRFLVAVVDQINRVDERNENNNWDIEQLLSTDLEMRKEIARIQPLQIGANFELGSDSLNSKGRQDINNQPLEELKIALAAPNFHNTYLEIGGHTDDRGSDEFNNDLSFRRAKWIKNYLVKQFDFDSTRIAAIGYGESNPVHDSVSIKYTKNDQGWYQMHEDNRRIEMRWLRNSDGIAPPDIICNSNDCASKNPTVRAAFVGQKIDYQITVKNLSPNTADRAKVIDLLPEYFELDESSIKSTQPKAAFVTRGDSLMWICKVAGNDSVQFNYQVKLSDKFVNLIQKLENKARVITQLDYLPTNNSDSTSITGIGDIRRVSEEHTVRCGETLSTIAAMYYGNPAEYPKIQSANNMGSSVVITPGQKLKVPGEKTLAKLRSDNVEIITYGKPDKIGNEIVGYLTTKLTQQAVPAENLIYRWKRDNLVISTCAAYKIQSIDAGKNLAFEILDKRTNAVLDKITVQIPTEIVVGLPSENKPPSIAKVTLNGYCVIGSKLEGDYSGYSDPNGDKDKSKVEWLRGDDVVTRNTKEYTVVKDDLGECIQFRVIPFDGKLEGEAKFSKKILIPKVKLPGQPCPPCNDSDLISQN